MSCFGCRKSKSSNEIVLLLLGLDNSGKTSLIHRMNNDPTTPTPSYGFSKFTTKIKTKKGKIPVDVYDLGGGPKIRGIWNNYLAEAYGVIYVVDSSDHSRINESKKVLHEIYNDPKLSGKPLLVLANKQDLNDTYTANDIYNNLKLAALPITYTTPQRKKNKKIDGKVSNEDAIMLLVQQCCLSTKFSGSGNDPAVVIGLNWIVQTIQDNISVIEPRVINDKSAQQKWYEEEKLRFRNSITPAQEPEQPTKVDGNETGEENASAGDIKSDEKSAKVEGRVVVSGAQRASGGASIPELEKMTGGAQSVEKDTWATHTPLGSHSRLQGGAVEAAGQGREGGREEGKEAEFAMIVAHWEASACLICDDRPTVHTLVRVQALYSLPQCICITNPSLVSFVAHSSLVNCLKIGRKSASVLATGGDDKKVNLWSIGSTTPYMSLTGHASPIESITLDPSEQIVVAGSSLGSIKLWDLIHAKPIRTLPGHKSVVRAVEFHPFGEFFASGSDDSTVKIWDIRRRGCIQTYPGLQGDSVHQLRITPDGRWIATGTSSGVVKIWDMTAGKTLYTYNDHSTPIVGLTFSPTEAIMGSMASDGSIFLYDLQEFSQISSIPVSNSAGRGQARVLEFDYEGTYLVAGFTNSLEIWQWEPPRLLESLQTPWNGLVDLRAVPNGKFVAGTIDQNFVGIWGGTIGVNHILSNFSPYSFANQISRFQQFEFLEDESTTSDQINPQSNIFGIEKLSISDPSSPFDTPQQQPETLPHPRYPKSVSFQSLSDPEPREPRPRKPTPTESLPDDTKPTTTHPRKPQKIIPSSGAEKPIGLEISRFITSKPHHIQHQIPDTMAPQLSPTSTPSDILQSMLARHTSVLHILNSRLVNLKVVRGVWDDGGVVGAVEVLKQVGDNAVVVDLLRVLNIKPKLVTLECAGGVLGLVRGLIMEGYEEYIMTACTTIRLLAKSFSSVVISTLYAAETGRISGSGGMVDLSAEERVQKCRVCNNAFLELIPVLENFGRASGHVGVAIRDTLQELQVFNQ
ncbi:ADP-ribosylation factor-like protein 13B [Nowakowskiella sp. JEL0407]|nr:ADP-ribosylation factor-like protein 13B [Nowakowskiella sp. JEL0407]